VRAPLALGVKVTLIVQLPPEETLLPHVFCLPVVSGIGPGERNAADAQLEFESLVRVTVCGALVDPTPARQRLAGG